MIPPRRSPGGVHGEGPGGGDVGRSGPGGGVSHDGVGPTRGDGCVGEGPRDPSLHTRLTRHSRSVRRGGPPGPKGADPGGVVRLGPEARVPNRPPPVSVVDGDDSPVGTPDSGPPVGGGGDRRRRVGRGGLPDTLLEDVGGVGGGTERTPLLAAAGRPDGLGEAGEEHVRRLRRPPRPPVPVGPVLGTVGAETPGLRPPS